MNKNLNELWLYAVLDPIHTALIQVVKKIYSYFCFYLFLAQPDLNSRSYHIYNTLYESLFFITEEFFYPGLIYINPCFYLDISIFSS